MSLTVQTNQSALAALQALNRATGELDEAQRRIATGQDVSRASDDSTRFSVAEALRADIEVLDSVGLSLDRAVSIADVALSSAETVSNLLIQLQERALGATDASLEASARQALQADFAAIADQLATVVANAEFDDVNLLNGTVTPGIEFLADADTARTITLRSQNLTYGGPTITFDPAVNTVATVTDAQATLTALQASFDNVNTALSSLGADSRKFEAHTQFVERLQDTLETGVGQLVDADLAAESARLSALQVQQALGVQSLSIANSRPEAILSLFQA